MTNGYPRGRFARGVGGFHAPRFEFIAPPARTNSYQVFALVRSQAFVPPPPPPLAAPRHPTANPRRNQTAPFLARRLLFQRVNIPAARTANSSSSSSWISSTPPRLPYPDSFVSPVRPDVRSVSLFSKHMLRFRETYCPVTGKLFMPIPTIH
jgi:hypothetical protein